MDVGQPLFIKYYTLSVFLANKLDEVKLESD